MVYEIVLTKCRFKSGEFIMLKITEDQDECRKICTQVEKTFQNLGFDVSYDGFKSDKTSVIYIQLEDKE